MMQLDIWLEPDNEKDRGNTIEIITKEKTSEVQVLQQNIKDFMKE